jgi:hypothetical protein
LKARLFIVTWTLLPPLGALAAVVLVAGAELELLLELVLELELELEPHPARASTSRGKARTGKRFMQRSLAGGRH